VARTRLVEDVVDVVLHGPQLNVESAGDLLVRESLVDEMQHLAFATRQVLRWRRFPVAGQRLNAVQQRRGDTRSAKQLTAFDRLDGLQQRRHGSVTRDDRRHARLRTGHHIFLSLRDREGEHSKLRQDRTQGRHRSIEVDRHGIDQRDIGSAPLDALHRLERRAGRTCDREPGVFTDGVDETVTVEAHMRDDEYADHGTRPRNHAILTSRSLLGSRRGYLCVYSRPVLRSSQVMREIWSGTGRDPARKDRWAGAS